MNQIERYNTMRDREQEAFDRSKLGEISRKVANFIVLNGSTSVEIGNSIKLSLAAEYAFGARMPAFYAGRAMRIW